MGLGPVAADPGGRAAARSLGFELASGVALGAASTALLMGFIREGATVADDVAVVAASAGKTEGAAATDDEGVASADASAGALTSTAPVNVGAATDGAVIFAPIVSVVTSTASSCCAEAAGSRAVPPGCDGQSQ